MLIVSRILAAAAILVLIERGRTVRGTTLVGPWCWLLVSMSACAASLYFARDAHKFAPLRLATGVMMLCPAIALLGAKRPQAQAWQFIVATLWLVMALPAFHHMVMVRPGEFRIHAAHAWFLMFLLALGGLNSLFGRFCPFTIMVVTGQVLVLWPFLPMGLATQRDGSLPWGIASFAAGICLAGIMTHFDHARPTSLQGLWREFRDAYGLAWSMRVAERLNAVSRRNDWGIRLGWGGFYDREGNRVVEDGSSALEILRPTFRSILRRFVDDPWISRRLGDVDSGKE